MLKGKIQGTSSDGLLIKQYRNEQQGHSFEICVSTNVVLRMLSVAFSQPVKCINFWVIKTQKWLVAASNCKLHNHWGTGCTVEWPYCPFAIL